MTRRFFWAFAAIALILQPARVALATITVHDLSQDTATGVFTYTVQLDNAANVQGSDGFVLYDFPGFASYSLTGDLTTSQFSLLQTLTSNILTQTASVDAMANVAAISNGMSFDNPAVENLSFTYDGSLPLDGPATAILTIDTTVLGGITDSIYASVDHSGPTTAHPFSFSANPIAVPASVPEPSVLALTTIGAFGLIARRRRVA